MADRMDIPILVLDLDENLEFVCREPTPRDGLLETQIIGGRTFQVFARIEVTSLTWFWNARLDVSYDLCAPPDMAALWQLQHELKALRL